MSKRSELFQRAKQPEKSKPLISKELASELALLEQVPDDEIDMTDVPEELDWANAAIGKYYRPIKEPVSLRIDSDVLSWFKSFGKGYQSRINAALRRYMYASVSAASTNRSSSSRTSGAGRTISKEYSRKVSKVVAKKRA